MQGFAGWLYVRLPPAAAQGSTLIVKPRPFRSVLIPGSVEKLVWRRRNNVESEGMERTEEEDDGVERSQRLFICAIRTK